MSMQMIVDSEIHHLSIPDRYFAYARAYRNAAQALCEKMTLNDGSCSWPNASVVLMLAAHAVELFLKGAILARDPVAILNHHQIDELGHEYSKLFPETSFLWQIPFKTEYVGIPEEEIDTLKKKTPIPSILYRYPVDKDGTAWKGLFGFMPLPFVTLLEHMENDFERIQSQLTLNI